MDEYIKKEDAMEIVKRTSGDYAVAFSEIRKLPAEDVAPVRHGKWVNERSRIKMYYAEYCYDCSECGQSTGYDRYSRSSFCPCCGARMDEEK